LEHIFIFPCVVPIFNATGEAHIIAENLVKPCVKDIAFCVLGDKKPKGY
jgi:hypothetical protein